MYNISRENINFNIKSLKNMDEVYFDSPLRSGDPNVDKVKALLYKGNSKEGVVFIHGLGERNFEYLKYYPSKLSKSGYTTIMLILPYHYNRMPKDKNISFLYGTSSDIEKRFYQSVVDTLTCIDFLEKVGIEKIHIMGFSFGGMIATISLALDHRINKGILVVTGGNFEYITWKSVATKVLRIRYEDEDSCSPERCHKLHKNFNEKIKEVNSLEDLNKLPNCYRYDPSLFAKKIDNKKVLMFNALFDPFIPRKSSQNLWINLNKPKIYRLPSGHLTSHLWFKNFIFKKSLDFLNEKTSKNRF